MMKCIKVMHEDTKAFYIEAISNLPAIIDSEFFDAEVGDKVILEVVSMSEEEYKALPEFMGW